MLTSSPLLLLLARMHLQVPYDLTLGESTLPLGTLVLLPLCHKGRPLGAVYLLLRYVTGRNGSQGLLVEGATAYVCCARHLL